MMPWLALRRYSLCVPQPPAAEPVELLQLLLLLLLLWLMLCVTMCAGCWWGARTPALPASPRQGDPAGAPVAVAVRSMVVTPAAVAAPALVAAAGGKAGSSGAPGWRGTLRGVSPGGGRVMAAPWVTLGGADTALSCSNCRASVWWRAVAVGGGWARVLLWAHCTA
jgi:hypothetical protein